MTLQAAQEIYDNMQPENHSISAGDSATVDGFMLGDWPADLVVSYTIMDDSDEYGQAWYIQIDSAKIGNFDFLECLHEGAISQLEDDVQAYLEDR